MVKLSLENLEIEGNGEKNKSTMFETYKKM